MIWAEVSDVAVAEVLEVADLVEAVSYKLRSSTQLSNELDITDFDYRLLFVYFCFVLINKYFFLNDVIVFFSIVFLAEILS